jgi:hypothetical protein
MFYALFGVFAFQTVLTNANVTIFEKSVLAFQEWTGKSRDPAVTSAQHRQVQVESNRSTALANKLIEIDTGKLRSCVLDAFKKAGERLIEDSKDYQQKCPGRREIYVALAFSRTFPDRAASCVKQEKSKFG